MVTVTFITNAMKIVTAPEDSDLHQRRCQRFLVNRPGRHPIQENPP